MLAIGKRYPVDDRLSGVLSHFYVTRLDTGAPSEIYHLSPNLEMMVVFNFGTPVSISFGNNDEGTRIIERIAILGPLRKMMDYELKSGADLLVLPFIYDGFYRFLPASVADRDLSTLGEAEIANYVGLLETLWEKLAAAPSPEMRIQLLTDYLVKQGISTSETATKPLLENEPDLYNRAINPVKSIADKASVSERTVQLRFKKYAGYSSKELLRFLRFKQVLAHVRLQGLEVDWFAVIVQFGYHDQSHLIKDFKYYTGVSPKQFLLVNEGGNFCVGRA